jgi:hypothetical protein
MLDFFIFDPLQKQIYFQKTVENQEQAEGLANTYNQNVMFATYEYSHKEKRRHYRFVDSKSQNADSVDIYKLVNFWKGKTCKMNGRCPNTFYRFNPIYTIKKDSSEIEIREPFSWELEIDPGME